MLIGRKSSSEFPVASGMRRANSLPIVEGKALASKDKGQAMRVSDGLLLVYSPFPVVPCGLPQVRLGWEHPSRALHGANPAASLVRPDHPAVFALSSLGI
jgi:hypothetical protein